MFEILLFFVCQNKIISVSLSFNTKRFIAIPKILLKYERLDPYSLFLMTEILEIQKNSWIEQLCPHFVKYKGGVASQ